MYLVNIDLNQFAYAIMVPFCIWLTVSTFNQRQEIALLKQAVDSLKTIVENLLGGEKKR